MVLLWLFTVGIPVVGEVFRGEEGRFGGERACCRLVHPSTDYRRVRFIGLPCPSSLPFLEHSSLQPRSPISYIPSSSFSFSLSAVAQTLVGYRWIGTISTKINDDDDDNNNSREMLPSLESR